MKDMCINGIVVCTGDMKSILFIDVIFLILYFGLFYSDRRANSRSKADYYLYYRKQHNRVASQV